MRDPARRAGQIVSGAAALLTLIGLLVGTPIALVLLAGVPDRLPTLAEAGQAMIKPDESGRLFIAAVAVVGWLAWLTFTVSVVSEIRAHLRGRVARRLPLLGPQQRLAAVLVAAVSLLVTGPAISPAAAFVSTVTTADRASTTVAAVAPTATPAPHAIGRTAAVAAAPAIHTTTATAAPAAPINAVAPKPVGSITVLINGRPYEHRVIEGESLSRIADRYLGDPDRWPEIWQLNKGKYWPHVSGRTTFSHPDLIFPGWVLTLPADAKALPGAQPTDPPLHRTPPPAATHPPTTVNPTRSTVPTTTASPTPSVTAPGGGDAVAPSSAAPTPSATATPAPATPTTGSATSSPQAPASPTGAATPTQSPSPTGESEASPATPGWIQLTGGFISAGLGAGLLYAAALVWKRRRHQYKPTPITTPVLDDPDLTPPLGALTYIRQTLRRRTPELLDHKPDHGPTVREYTTADVKPPLPPVGPTGADLAGVGTLAVTAGLGLRGPAALDAARALLVTTLTSGHPDDPDAQGQVVVPAATLATLLGVSAVDLGPMHRLTVAPTFADALTLVEEEIIRRSRIIADHEAADVPTLRQTDALAEPLPQLLLITDLPDQGWHTRLATAIRLGKAVEIGTTLIGDWPHGTTLTVEADGSTTDGDGQQVAVLDTTATSEILAMLREAHGDAPPPAATRGAPATPAPVRHQAPEPAADGGDAVARPPDAATTAPRRPTSLVGGGVRVRVLGSPAILGPDGTPIRGLRAKSLELLVYLAVHRSGASLTDIMEAIWPDATLRRASERLSTCVANLRGIIRAAAQPAAGPTDTNDSSGKAGKPIEPVINTGGHYHLDPTLLHVDWWTVLDEYTHVATARDDTTRLAHLQAAIDAIGAGLANGVDYEWIDTDREHARRHMIKIYAQAAQLLTDTDPHQARAYRDAACDLDPLSDELARLAMHAAARLGDANAIRDRLATLRRELDDARIELDPDTEQLAADLLRDLANP